MTLHYEDDRVTLWHADCRDVLANLPDASVDACVTDPPYELGFMGKGWDASGIAYDVDLWRDVLRVLKPGGHLLAFGGSRTWHRLVCAVEDAGFEIRDGVMWVYGAGFPKSLDVSKAIDKAAGAQREVVGTRSTGKGNGGEGHDFLTPNSRAAVVDITAPATPAAQQWQGWGTALKPAFEPIVVARKPLAGTVAANVLAHGTGALNIDATRVATSPGVAGSSRGGSTTCTCPVPAATRTTHTPSTSHRASSAASPEGHSDRPASALGHESDRLPLQDSRDGYPSSPRSGDEHAPSAARGGRASQPPRPDAPESLDRRATPAHNPADRSTACAHCTAGNVETGRWPANLVLTHAPDCGLDDASGECVEGCPVRELDEQSGVTTSRASAGRNGADLAVATFGLSRSTDEVRGHDDSGGASRFFPAFRYEPKAPTDERPRHDGTAHPTVKPLDLMRWLVRLVTPPGGVILEPFAGSGTTCEAAVAEGFRCIAVEQEAAYLPLITQRLTKRSDPVAHLASKGEDLGLFELLDGEAS